MLHVPHVGRRVCDRGDRVKTYLCEICGAVIGENEFATEKDTLGLNLEERGGIQGESYSVCPQCGSDEYTEAEYCEHCKEPYPIRNVDEGICDDCLFRIKKDFSAELEGIFAKHESSYRKAANLAYDGKEL